MDNTDNLCALFRALSRPKCLEICAHLVEHGECDVRDLYRAFGNMAGQSPLNILEKSGMISFRTSKNSLLCDFGDRALISAAHTFFESVLGKIQARADIPLDTSLLSGDVLK